MDIDDLEAIQARYIAALRAAVPALRAWWEGLVDRLGEEAAFERWPTGPAGHPTVLDIFRDAFFAIEEWNDAVAEGFEEPPLPDPEALWGEVDRSPAPLEARPADWLIRDLEDDAPDLYGLVAGLVFVPVGQDQDGASC